MDSNKLYRHSLLKNLIYFLDYLILELKLFQVIFIYLDKYPISFLELSIIFMAMPIFVITYAIAFIGYMAISGHIGKAMPCLYATSSLYGYS